MNEKQGSIFNTVGKYYKDYGIRAKELKKEGKPLSVMSVPLFLWKSFLRPAVSLSG
jgi:hypothetical protein